MRKKLKDNGGFSFVEMLCAVIILVLLCLMTNTGLNMAMNTYRDLTAESETQLLLNSLADAIADKLRYATVTTDATGAVTGYAISGGGNVDLNPNPSDATAQIVTVGGKDLLPDGVYGNDGAYGAAVRYTVDEATVTPYISGTEAVFTVQLKVSGVPNAISGISAETEFTVRCLNPTKEEP